MTDFEKMQGLLQEKKDAEDLISKTYDKIEKISQAQADLLNEIIEKNFPKGYVSFKEDVKMWWNCEDLKGKDAYIKATNKRSSYGRNYEVYLEAFRMDSKGISKRPERLWDVKIDKDIIEQILVVANPYQKEIVNEFENPDLLKKHLQKLVKEMYDKEFFTAFNVGEHRNIRFSDRFICNYLKVKKWEMTPEQYEEIVKGVCTCGCIEFNYDMWYAKNITATFFDALQGGRIGYVDGYLKGMETYYTKKGLTHEAEFLNGLLDWGKEKAKELEEDYVNSYKDEDDLER